MIGGGALNATGNNLSNVLTGNDASNVLDGGRSADSMAGGKGDDTYKVDFGLDQVNEAASQGTDTIISEVPQLLVLNVENLTLGESAGNIEGIGNAASNVIVGNNSANLLDGAAGNDTLKGEGGDDTLLGADGNDSLSGGSGRDVLVGGVGADHFVFDSAVVSGTNVDQVMDFVHGQDFIDLSTAIFTTLSAAGTAAAAANTAQVGDFVKGSDAVALLTKISAPAGAADAPELDHLEFVSGPGAVATNAREHIVHDTSTGMLYYDADGSGAQHMLPFAQMAHGEALVASDFHLIA